MIEGVLRHCTELEVDRQYVDSHGQSVVAFAFTKLLGFQLLPRLKAIHAQRLYRPDTGQPDVYPNLQAVLSRPIDWELIARQHDEMVKYATALRLGTADAEAILRRFTRENIQHPTYLRRRGWKERVATRAYMAALQNSVMSLYEVSDIVPGQSLRARDLVRGGEPVLVTERSATQTLKSWDRIAARIVPQGDQSILAGGLLAFTLEGSQQLLAQLRERVSPPGNRQGGNRRGGKRPQGASEGWHGSDDDLRRAAPLFTTAWLFDMLPRALRTDPPTVLNSDGDDVVFHTVNFPMASGATAGEIERRLNAVQPLRQETPTFWNWLGEPASPRRARPKGQKALVWNVTMDDGTVVLGNIELKGRIVALSANSAVRAERGGAMLAAALGGLVAKPLTEIQTVEQMRAAPAPHRDPPTAPVPAEAAAELVHDMLDRQYRALLGEPIPMLGDMSPRTAAAAPAAARTSRSGSSIWRTIPRHTEDRDDPMATYDFSWLWRELKIEHLRN